MKGPKALPTKTVPKDTTNTEWYNNLFPKIIQSTVTKFMFATLILKKKSYVTYFRKWPTQKFF